MRSVGPSQPFSRFDREAQQDASTFDKKYSNDETGRWAYDPKVLLKIVLLAYSRGLSAPKGKRAARRRDGAVPISANLFG